MLGDVVLSRCAGIFPKLRVGGEDELCVQGSAGMRGRRDENVLMKSRSNEPVGGYG